MYSGVIIAKKQECVHTSAYGDKNHICPCKHVYLCTLVWNFKIDKNLTVAKVYLGALCYNKCLSILKFLWEATQCFCAPVHNYTPCNVHFFMYSRFNVLFVDHLIFIGSLVKSTSRMCTREHMEIKIIFLSVNMHVAILIPKSIKKLIAAKVN